jgi:hypothetical protein
VSNTYQKNRRRAQPDPMPAQVAVPEQVIVSMAEIAESAGRLWIVLPALLPRFCGGAGVGSGAWVPA